MSTPDMSAEVEAATQRVRDLGEQVRRGRGVLSPRHSEHRNSNLPQSGANIEVGQRLARQGVRVSVRGA